MEANFLRWKDSSELSLGPNPDPNSIKILKEAAECFYNWKNHITDRLDEFGNILPLDVQFEHYFRQEGLSVNKTSRSANFWKSRGPSNTFDGGRVLGIGLSTKLAVHPIDTNLIYIYSDGGIWRSLDGGNFWDPIGDSVADLSVTLLQLDPINPNIIYLGIGGKLLKSFDGANTWDTLFAGGFTGTNFLIDPVNTNILFWNHQNLLRKSNDGGYNWDTLQSPFNGILLFNPLNSQHLLSFRNGYLYKSYDAGLTFQSIAAIPSTYNNMAISSVDTNYIYFGWAGSYDGKYAQSTDGGYTLTQFANTSNVFQMTGCNHLFLSRRNKNILIQGGAQCSRSVNGGATWNFATPYNYGGNPSTYIHPDTRAMDYVGKTLWVATDGGINKSYNDGVTWIHVTNNLSITDVHDLGISRADTSIFIVGAPHNSHLVHTATGWRNILAGDGYNAAINPNDTLHFIGKNQYGPIYSIDGDVTWNSAFTGINESSYGFSADYPILFNPQNPKSVYFLVKQVWKSTNRGASSTAISNFPTASAGGKFLYICEIDSNVIYTANHHTINGGASWTPNTFKVLSVDPDEPQKIWMLGSPNGIYQYFYSDDWGVSYTAMPSLDVYVGPNAKMASADNIYNGVYLYYNREIYYIDDRLSNWQPLNENLPYIGISDIEVAADYNLVRIGTYGRGVWEASNNYNFNQAPIADFVASKYSECPMDTIQFFDNSLFNGPGYNPIYSWHFPGGTPSASNLSSPKVVYMAPGIYDVSLTITNDNGFDSTFITQVININIPGSIPYPYTQNFELNPTDWNINHSATTWTRPFGNGGYTLSNYGMRFYLPIGHTGKTEYILSPPFDLSNSTLPILKFDYKSNFSITDPDTLKVFYTTDCGLTKNYIYTKGGSELATYTSSSITNNVAYWKTDTILLSGLSGLGDVQFGFEAKGMGFTEIALDNINISECLPPVSPNISGSDSICGALQNTYSFTLSGGITDYTWLFPPTWTSSNGNYQVQISASESDTLKLSVENKCGLRDTSFISLYVDVPFVYSNSIIGPDAVCVGTMQNYSITDQFGLGIFNWDVPSDWNISSGESSDSLSVLIGSVGGILSFNFENLCGVYDTLLVVSVLDTPQPSDILSSSQEYCENDTISIFAINNGDGSHFIWNLPSTFSIIGNADSNIISVVGGNANGIIYLYGQSICGVGNQDSVSMFVHNLPEITFSGSPVICEDQIECYTANGALTYQWTAPCQLSFLSDSICVSGNFLQSCSGNFIVHAVDSVGCRNSDTLNLMVTEYPEVDAGPDLVICVGDTVQVQSNSDFPVQWFPSNGLSSNNATSPLAYPISSTTYVMIANNNSCQVTDSMNIIVHSLPLTELQFSFTDTICDYSGLIPLSGGSPTGGYYFGTGVTGQYFDPQYAGIGTWELTYYYIDSNGCANSAVDEIEVSGCLSIEESNASFKIFPNPFENYLQISGMTEKSELFLLDATGKLVFKQGLAIGDNRIEFPSLADGTYFVKILNTQGTFIFKSFKN